MRVTSLIVTTIVVYILTYFNATFAQNTNVSHAVISKDTPAWLQTDLFWRKTLRQNSKRSSRKSNSSSSKISLALIKTPPFKRLLPSPLFASLARSPLINRHRVFAEQWKIDSRAQIRRVEGACARISTPSGVQRRRVERRTPGLNSVLGGGGGVGWRNHVSGTAARRVRRFPNVSPEILASLPGFDTLPLVCTYRRASLCPSTAPRGRGRGGVDLHARFRVWSTTEHVPRTLYSISYLPLVLSNLLHATCTIHIHIMVCTRIVLFVEGILEFWNFGSIVNAFHGIF